MHIWGGGGGGEGVPDIVGSRGEGLQSYKRAEGQWMVEGGVRLKVMCRRNVMGNEGRIIRRSNGMDGFEGHTKKLVLDAGVQ